MEVTLTENGYLQMSAAVARQYFPEDVLVALVRNSELWLLPLRGAAAGGLLLKQRNLQGDRSLIIWEVFNLAGVEPVTGVRPAFWDERSKALRVALNGQAEP